MALPALLSSDDLVKFRTRFCERFLQFGECNFGGKCQYSHNMAWRRRSPQKYLYEPRMCENIISYGNVGSSGVQYRHSVLNCHNGKNCKFSHSREEVLYHPLVYKTVMCEDFHCTRYYCPFGHSHEELLPSHENPEYIKRCIMEVIMEQDENDFSDNEMSGGGVTYGFENASSEQGNLVNPIVESSSATFGPSHDTAVGLRMRKASGSGGIQLQSSCLSSQSLPPVRLSLPVPGSAEWNISDLSAWVAVAPNLRIETVIRAHSPVVSSELCRALLSRDLMQPRGKSGGGAVLGNHPGNQFCLAKVMQFVPEKDNMEVVSSQLVSELNTLAKGEHKNLLGIKKLYFGQMPRAAAAGGASNPSSGESMLCIAFEQCATSLQQVIQDGYSGSASGVPVASSVKGLAKKLNPHTGVTTTTAIQRINDLISGLQRLHFTGVAHLRLCPSNVLIDGEANFKLGDFLGKYGLVGIGKGVVAAAAAESVLVWQPVEVVRSLRVGRNNNFSCFDKIYRKSDVFSLGCCIFFALTGQHPFGLPKGPALENIHSDYIANQHLLYNCPLVLDLCLRCLAQDPQERPDANELSRHPLFWDFEYIRNFVFNLPTDCVGFVRFAFDYELEGWKKLVADTRTTNIVDKYSDSIGGVVGYLVDKWKEGSPSNAMSAASVWIRVLDRFPQILVRLWDGTRLVAHMPSNSEALDLLCSRTHLHWMTLRSSAVTSISHSFVREYYQMIGAVLCKKDLPPPCFPDESPGLSDACKQCVIVESVNAATASSFLKAAPPRPSPPVTPAVTSVIPWQYPMPDDTNGTPGMKFVDPLVVKQMAAASAALSAIYENPELVNAIIKQDKSLPVGGPYHQLLAAAAIYASLLEGSATRAW